MIMKKLNYMAASLPEGLKCETIYSESIKDIIGASLGNNILFRVAPIEQRDYPVPISHIIPILRPLSDLTKPIVQENYNGGKEFVPIVELAKIAWSEPLLKKYEIFNLGVKYIFDGDVHTFEFWNYTNSFHLTRITPRQDFMLIDNQLQLFQLLFKWHFDLITEDCEKVYVTDGWNPYL